MNVVVQVPMSIARGVLCALLLLLLSVDGLNNGVARTPPMGFSDSCLGGTESDRLNETRLYNMAQAFISSGLQAKGYVYMNIDDSWELFNRSTGGELVPDPEKFPNGMVPVAEKLHLQNLKLGLYTSDAERSCKRTAGSLYHEVQDAHTLSEMKIDFIKVDNCGEVNLNSYAKYSALRDAFNASRQAANDLPIVYSCEPHVTSMIGWLPTVCNMWRTTSDNCKTAFNFSKVVSVVYQNNIMAANAMPGAWNDLDPVMVGTAKKDGTQGLTPAEARSVFTLYAVVKSPLLLGVDPSTMPAEYLAIVGNEELIACNQDPVGKAAVCVGNNTAPPIIEQAIGACAAEPPKSHECCMHPHCKPRNKTECINLNCCYSAGGGTPTGAIDLGSSACWKPPTPTPPVPPLPSPSPPTPPAPTPASAFALVASCDWPGQAEQQQYGQSQEALLPSQAWELRPGGYIANAKANICLTASPLANGTSISFSLETCSASTKGQRFGNTEQAKVTVAQIYLPEDSVLASGSGSTRVCLATNGTALLAMECLHEPEECKTKRCALSVLYQQLWYRSSTTAQLISTFTKSPIPPLSNTAGSANVGGWGPEDGPLVNIPVCLGTAANPHPPTKIPLLSPAGVLSKNPSQTVWAGPLANSSLVVVLWNTGPTASNITAWWEQLGLPPAHECSVRDLHAHIDKPRASTSMTFEVPSHDVVALKLSDCRSISSALGTAVHVH
jgi:hypothetical protein